MPWLCLTGNPVRVESICVLCARCGVATLALGTEMRPILGKARNAVTCYILSWVPPLPPSGPHNTWTLGLGVPTNILHVSAIFSPEISDFPGKHLGAPAVKTHRARDKVRPCAMLTSVPTPSYLMGKPFTGNL